MFSQFTSLSRCRSYQFAQPTYTTYKPHLLFVPTQGRPGVTNLVSMHAALSDTLTTPEAVVAARSTMKLEDFKEELAELVVDLLKPIQVSW